MLGFNLKLGGGAGGYVADYRPLISYEKPFAINTSSIDKTKLLADGGASPLFPAELFFGRRVYLTVDQSIPTTISGQVQTIYRMEDDAHVYEEGTQTLTNYEINESFATVTLGNFIFNDGIFTTAQKEYLANYPEKFLYKESGVLKSHILSQTEIDNIVAYLPMCETDAYVRDLVDYSETEIIDEPFDDNSNGWTLGSGWSIAGGKAVRDATVGGTNLSLSTLVSGKWYKIKYKFLAVTGCAIYGGTLANLVVNVVTISEDEVVFQSDGTTLYFRASSEVELEYTVVEELIGTYQIANYTSAVRDDAINLTKGLQTCNWVRDALGVPTSGSFDRLECDGVGYADTGYNVVYTESKLIEYVVDERTGDLSAFGNILYAVGGTALYSRFNVGETSKIGTNVNGFGYTEVTISAPTHMLLHITDTGYTLYKNGSSQGLKNTAGGTNSGLLTIGATDSGVQQLQAPIDIFKVHTDMNQLDNAIARGLTYA